MDRELAKVARIRVAMKSSQDISEEMISILQSFEDKLESLEKTILPVHKATRNLMTKQSNLEDTISQVDILIQHQQLAFQAKSLLSISSIEIDLTEFLRLLDRIRLAMSYFHEKSNLKESTARYRELRAALATGLIQCEQEFIKVMAKAPYNTTRAIVPSEEIAKDSESSKAEDKSTMMGSEISGDEENPEDQELAPIIDIQIIARLGAIAACLVRNKKMGFIELFEKERSRQCLEVLMRTCERTFDSNGSYGSLDGKEDILLTSSRPPVIDESAIDLKTKTTRYMSGQHQSLVYIRMLLQVLKLEESVFRETLQRQGGVSSQEYLEAYQKAMEASTDFIIKKVFKAILNESGQNKLLVSLDFLGTLQTLIPQFLEVAPDVDGNGGEGGDKKHFRDRMGSIKRDGDARRKKTPSLREKILQFRLKICELCGLALAEYEQSIRKHGRIKRKKMPQAVHVVTVETINFLFRSLYSYKSTLESRDIERVSEISDARHNFPAITITGSLILWLLDSLELTLKELATKQIQNASLGWVFILNNLQLLDKRMRDASRLLSMDIHPADVKKRFGEKIKEALHSYTNASWTKAVEAMSMENWPLIQSHCHPIQIQGKKKMEADSWAKKAIKHKWKEFNHHFAKQYERQKTWLIPDSQLRARLRNANIDSLLPKYRDFYQKYQQVKFTRNAGKHMKLQPEVLVKMLGEFFEEANR